MREGIESTAPGPRRHAVGLVVYFDRRRGGRIPENRGAARDPSNLIWVIPAKGTRWTGDGRAQPGSGRVGFGQVRPMTCMVNGRPMDSTDGVIVHGLRAQPGGERTE